MDSQSTHQLLGKLLACQENLAQDVNEIKTAINSRADRIEIRLAALELVNATESGGKRMLIGLLGAAGMIGGLIATMIDKLWHA